MGGKKVLDSSRLFFATSGPTSRRKHYFCLLFSQYWVGVEQINVLLTSPSNQFRDYFIWNRIEKLMPQLWNFSTQTLKILQNTDQLVFKPWLFAEIWVSKNPGFVHGFSMEAGLSRPKGTKGIPRIPKGVPSGTQGNPRDSHDPQGCPWGLPASPEGTPRDLPGTGVEHHSGAMLHRFFIGFHRFSLFSMPWVY